MLSEESDTTGTDWQTIAAKLSGECPSASVRAYTVELLAIAEQLGPIRPPEEEFRRAYKSLHWNEAERVKTTAKLLLARTRGSEHRVAVRAEAWQYIIAALDEWIMQGRVYYVVTGILESALRTRVDARLSDYYETPDWPNKGPAVPSELRKRWNRNAQNQQLRQVQSLLKRQLPEDAQTTEYRQLLTELRAAVAEQPAPPMPRGDEYLRQYITLFDLLMWFQGGRFWNDPIRMRELFRGRHGTDPIPQFDKLKSVLSQIYERRNEVAHYRPGADLSFAEPLFAAADLASWLGEDLQHIYASIDKRSSTELSILLGPLGEDVGGWSQRQQVDTCQIEGCVGHPPLDWLMKKAPRDRKELSAIEVGRACLFHRVKIRD